jgi:UDP-N-acetylglucosamine--N-acetylmuramyl-(pentapeptide) pyrophosphoryl-undecaprenol N-acetylglucosamine transferase
VIDYQYMRILFVGGGSGGHFYPLIAVAEELVHSPEQPELYYMGPAAYNAELLSKHGIRFVYCPAGKMRLYFSIQNFFDLFRNFFGLFVAIVKLYIIYPDVIFSKGGYTSVPVLLAAKILRIPVVIHESDSIPGRANLLAKKFSRYVAISYPETAQHFDANKTALTGIPIMTDTKSFPADPFGQLGLTKDLPLIYVTGGSLGAERVNNLILLSLDSLLPNFQIFHQVGPNRKPTIELSADSLITDPLLRARYHVAELVDAKTVSALLTAASLVITRAGSTTLFEIAIHGKPSIVIPIPEDVSRDQKRNAYAFARSGAAKVLEEGNVTENLLTAEINTIMGSPPLWKEMSTAAQAFAPTDAAQKIATLLLGIGKEHGS